MAWKGKAGREAEGGKSGLVMGILGNRPGGKSMPGWKSLLGS
jgi:hypothetical protein